jgi:hypothetical protein
MTSVGLLRSAEEAKKNMTALKAREKALKFLHTNPSRGAISAQRIEALAKDMGMEGTTRYSILVNAAEKSFSKTGWHVLDDATSKYASEAMAKWIVTNTIRKDKAAYLKHFGKSYLEEWVGVAGLGVVMWDSYNVVCDEVRVSGQARILEFEQIRPADVTPQTPIP